MNPGLWPAKSMSIPRTKATMAHAIGKRADMRILIGDLTLSLFCVGLMCFGERFDLIKTRCYSSADEKEKDDWKDNTQVMKMRKEI